MSVPAPDTPEETVWQGRFIAAKTRGSWEYVSRTRGIGAAVILAIDDGHVLLVEQYRVPLGRNCLELPAGLIGDEEGAERITFEVVQRMIGKDLSDDFILEMANITPKQLQEYKNEYKLDHPEA